MTSKKHVLVIFGGHTGGRTHALVDAVRHGLATEDSVDVRAVAALTAQLEDLLWAHALLICTPEHFGYMSGAVKDFFDRTFYPAEGKVDGLPYAIVVSAGNDGSGAVNAIDRIAIGYRWKKVAEPIIVKGDVTDAAAHRCQELGQTIAAGLALGIF